MYKFVKRTLLKGLFDAVGVMNGVGSSHSQLVMVKLLIEVKAMQEPSMSKDIIAACTCDFWTFELHW